MEGTAENAMDMEAQNLVREAQERVRGARARRDSKKPKSTVDGVKQGLLSLVGGIATGGVGLVAAPIASTAGAPKGKKLQSAVAGVAAGVGIAIVAPIAGAVQGVGKVISGSHAGGKARKTASGHAEEYEHMPFPPWQSDAAIKAALAADRAAYMRERSILYQGLVEDEALGSASASGSAVPDTLNGLPPPSDLTYYHALGLQPNATTKEIKHAYRKRSLAIHPDRPGGNADEFKAVGEAYQVLSDPERRKAYHQHGVSGVDTQSLIQPEMLYSLMLLPNGFRPLIGDATHAAMLATQHSGEDLEKVKAEIAEFNKKRVAELSQLLVLRIAPFVAGRTAEFTAFAEREVALLSGEPLGTDILKTVGYAYSGKARIFLAGGSSVPLKGFFSELADGASVLRKQLQAAVALKEMTEEDRNGEAHGSVDEAERRRAVTGLSAVFLTSMIDCQQIIREVVEVVCTEQGQPKEVLHRRAQAIAALGAIFSAA
jgi:X-domain of DnaJ-containing/DnaJ domain